MRSASLEHEERNGSQGPPSVSSAGRVERMGECASPLGEVVDVETPRRPLANTSCPLLSAAGSVLAPTGSRTAQAAGVAMAPHPTTILGLGESRMEDPLSRDRGGGTWGRICVLVQSSVQSRRLWDPGGAKWSPPWVCPLSCGPDLSLTMEGSALDAGIWVWRLVQTGRRTGGGGPAWKRRLGVHLETFRARRKTVLRYDVEEGGLEATGGSRPAPSNAPCPQPCEETRGWAFSSLSFSSSALPGPDDSHAKW